MAGARERERERIENKKQLWPVDAMHAVNRWSNRGTEQAQIDGAIGFSLAGSCMHACRETGSMWSVSSR